MSFPILHKRVILITGLGLLILQLSGIGSDIESHSEDAKHTINLENLADNQNPVKEALENSELVADTSSTAIQVKSISTTDKVGAGDSLAKIFTRNGYSAKDLHQISATKLANN